MNRMIESLAVILLCQLVGEIAARALALPVPGPVLGMALLFLLLVLRDRLRPGALASVEATGRGLIAHLSLLFIPAGVGVVRNLDVFVRDGVALSVALVVSTVLALATTVAIFRLVARWLGETSDAG
jgi:holin-like protein